MQALYGIKALVPNQPVDDKPSQQSRLAAGNKRLLAQRAPSFQRVCVRRALVPAVNGARCSFSVSADPVRLRLH